jgi:hypothetical protein
MAVAPVPMTATCFEPDVLRPQRGMQDLPLEVRLAIETSPRGIVELPDCTDKHRGFELFGAAIGF